MKQNITKLISTALMFSLVLFIALNVNSQILASASTDKKTFGENEVGLLTVKLMNDSEIELKGVALRIQGDEGIVFYEGMQEVPLYLKTIDSLKQNEVKQIVIKFKSTLAKKATSNIYAYYGKVSELTTASVTMIETKPSPVFIETSTKRSTVNSNEQIEIDYTLTNGNNTPIYGVSAEMIAPIGFEIITPQVKEEVVSPKGEMHQKFKVIAPEKSAGEQQIIIAYGYFDANTPHYFEKTFKFNIERPNYQLIILIGVVVLIVAGYLFFRKGKGSGVVGTDGKK